MTGFELLSMKLDRVKELMDATGADMETMITVTVINVYYIQNVLQ